MDIVRFNYLWYDLNVASATGIFTGYQNGLFYALGVDMKAFTKYMKEALGIDD